MNWLNQLNLRTKANFVVFLTMLPLLILVGLGVELASRQAREQAELEARMMATVINSTGSQNMAARSYFLLEPTIQRIQEDSPQIVFIAFQSIDGEIVAKTGDDSPAWASWRTGTVDAQNTYLVEQEVKFTLERPEGDEQQDFELDPLLEDITPDQLLPNFSGTPAPDRKAEVKLVGKVTIGVSMISVASTQRSLRVAGILLLAVAIALVWAIFFRSVGPWVHALNKLVTASKQVAGHASIVDLDLQRRDEIGHLNQAFAEMTVEVSRNRAELEEEIKERTSEIRIARDDEIKAKHEAIAAKETAEKARERAEEANRVKDRFVAKMAHEIRNPLNGVLGLLDIAYEDSKSPEQRNLARIAMASAKSLRHVVGNVLDLSRIQQNKVELSRSDFNLCEAVEEVIDALTISAEKCNLDLACFISREAAIDVNGDRGRLSQILTNLIGNALKFTPSGGIVVRVNLIELNDQVRRIEFQITDTGIGIPVDRQADLFKPFVQLDAEQINSTSGIGLGLSICKAFVKRMDGDIQLRSNVGEGSTFTVSIPFDVPAQPGVVEPEWLEELAEADIRVLVIDPSSISRTVLTDQMNEWKVRVETAADEEQAFAVLDTSLPDNDPFDVVLVSNYLKTTPAIALGPRIRQRDDRFRSMRLLLMTALTDRVNNNAQRRAGYDGCLTKPIHRNALVNILLDRGQDESEDIESLDTTDGPPAWASQLRILIAEDDFANQVIMSRLIGKAGYSYDVAKNGQEAVELFTAAGNPGYDLILMDWMMPIMDGRTATKQIRAFEATLSTQSLTYSPVPIIAVTANAEANDVSNFKSFGMDGWITKPVESNELFAMIAGFIGPGEPAPTSDVEDIEIPNSDLELASNAPFDPVPAAERLGGMETLIVGAKHFADQLDETVQTIADAIFNRDQANFEIVSHRLKGSASNISAYDLNRIGKQLEWWAIESDFESAELYIPQLRKSAQDFQRYYQEFAESLEASPDDDSDNESET